MRNYRLFLGCFLLLIAALEGCDRESGMKAGYGSSERVFLDTLGVMRWTHSGKEVALFGVNYCLPSACDYRAADYVNGDRKKMIDEDLCHFEKMGFDGLRLSFWGDWENSDRFGNLIQNDHLDLLDYLIWKAGERGISMLFTPIVTYNSLWPENLDDTINLGFSFHYAKKVLGTDPDAIRAQVNYLQQILTHENPYTGVPLKDEPNIIMIEPVNEPHHHPHDLDGSIGYINELVKGIRETGCKKPVCYNVSQDFGIIPAVQKAEVQGTSFAWYPTQLLNGRTLKGNHLHLVDTYDRMQEPELDGKAKIIYEFDTPDVTDSYLYPAMVREFRKGGAQFAAIFAYDMLGTAHANLGWQTHFLNMVYTPGKAVSAMIAGRAMHELPRLKDFGRYPANTRFGNFRVNYEENLSEYVSDTVFMHSNHTGSGPLKNDQLYQVVGCGSSPVVEYEGSGIYFLDQIKEGIWKLEIYPDAVIMDDPFSDIHPEREVCRLLSKAHNMAINLDDLGENFRVFCLNDNEVLQKVAVNGRIKISPGLYLLGRSGVRIKQKLLKPENYDYTAPLPDQMPPKVLHQTKAEHYAGNTLTLEAEVVSSGLPETVHFHFKNLGEQRFQQSEMTCKGGYTWSISLPPENLTPGLAKYFITVEEHDKVLNFPGGTFRIPPDEELFPDTVWKIDIKPENAPLTIFDATENRKDMTFTRIFKSPPFIWNFVRGSNPESLALSVIVPDFSPDTLYRFPLDVTAECYVGDRMDTGGEGLAKSSYLSLLARTKEIHCSDFALLLIDADGFSWGVNVPLTTEWNTIDIPISDMKPTKAAMLPQDWPGINDYWYPQEWMKSGGAPSMDLKKIERIQFSLRPDSIEDPVEKLYCVEIERVLLK